MFKPPKSLSVSIGLLRNLRKRILAHKISLPPRESTQGCHFPDNMKFPDFSRPRLSSTVSSRQFRETIHFVSYYLLLPTTFNTENDGPGQLLGYRALHKTFVNSMGLQFLVFFPPTQSDQSSSVGRRRHDDGMSSGVGT